MRTQSKCFIPPLIEKRAGIFLNELEGDDCFPLTPALSPVEREKRSQIFGEVTAVFGPVTSEFYENIQPLFPLPRGEGQGEGKAGKYPNVNLATPPDCGLVSGFPLFRFAAFRFAL